MVRLCFVAVEFVNDPNVVGLTYWYLCSDFDVEIGREVEAPLGKHDRMQVGVVRNVVFGDEQNSPFPIHLIKSINKIM